MKSITKIFLIMILTLISMTAFAQSNEGTKLKVAIHPYEPMVMVDNGEYSGFDIDLWESIAKKNGYDYEFVNTAEFSDIFDKIESKQIDVAISGISITREREQIGDFTYPYETEAGLSILAPVTKENFDIISHALNNLFSMETLKLLLMLGVLLLFFGLLLWVSERGADVISDNFKKGYPDAVWCSWAIMTTIGFGDIYPKKIFGRLLSLPIFLIGCTVVGIVMAPFVSALNAKEMVQFQSEIKSEYDLSDKKVGTKTGSTSVEVLDNLRAKIVTKNSMTELYQLLEKGKLDAVVFDSANIRYYTSKQKDSNLQIVGEVFEQQEYGILLTEGSSLREEINRTLLDMKKSGEYSRIYNKWFN